MKDLILAFEEQCWVNAGDEHQYFDSEKFAGLIVQDCVNVLNKRFTGDLNREDMEVRRCVADVQKHFGVEE